MPTFSLRCIGRRSLMILVVLTLVISSASADENLGRSLESSGLKKTAIGLDAEHRPFWGYCTPELGVPQRKPGQILLLVWQDDLPAVEAVRLLVDRHQSSSGSAKKSAGPQFSVILLERSTVQNVTEDWTFPPQGVYYSDPARRRAQYLWRWIGMSAPDAVVLVSTPVDGEVPPSGMGGLKLALPAQAACDVGRIPVLEFSVIQTELDESITSLLEQLPQTLSPAAAELQRRQNRSVEDVVNELAPFYGNRLDSAVYIPAVALLAKLRMARLQGSSALAAEVRRQSKIVAPYVAGNKPALPEKPSASHLSGHLLFAELAPVSDTSELIRLVREVAELGFDQSGAMRSSMPHHSEMSDSVFMAVPILLAAEKLTGDQKYADMAERHFQFMQKLCLRDDGLYRHSPLDEAAWGRGNGFPALGVTLSLEYMSEEHPLRSQFQTAVQQHLTALLPHQDASGMWRQVIDQPGSYRELTSTCMITYAMATGVRRGWLEAERFNPAIERGWRAVKSRVGTAGQLVDVCTGTGKQRTMKDYFDRNAILGRDDRGGAMVLLLASEMLRP